METRARDRLVAGLSDRVCHCRLCGMVGGRVVRTVMRVFVVIGALGGWLSLLVLLHVLQYTSLSYLGWILWR